MVHTEDDVATTRMHCYSCIKFCICSSPSCHHFFSKRAALVFFHPQKGQRFSAKRHLSTTMYRRECSIREREAGVDRKAPSFSYTLLDEIYRSIDDGRTEKWMEKKKRNSSPEKMEVDKKPNYVVDNDPLFFSSGSNSSDSNSSLFSEHEPIPVPRMKPRSSCFLPPKPIRTGVKQTEHDEAPASAKSRALKLYAHLKKMKQPISPGVKLTTFINSILPNSQKPSKRSNPIPTCSSASSFTGSNSVKRSVRSVPDNVVLPTRSLTRVDQEKNKASTKPQLHKSINAAATRPVEEDEDCAASDCSEDLFEIDHLKLCNGRYSGELPVHETTRVISSNHSRVAIKVLNL